MRQNQVSDYEMSKKEDNDLQPWVSEEIFVERGFELEWENLPSVSKELMNKPICIVNWSIERSGSNNYWIITLLNGKRYQLSAKKNERTQFRPTYERFLNGTFKKLATKFVYSSTGSISLSKLSEIEMKKLNEEIELYNVEKKIK